MWLFINLCNADHCVLQMVRKQGNLYRQKVSDRGKKAKLVIC